MESQFPRPYDVLIGNILVTCMVLGIPGNAVALYHFATSHTKNVNSTFFKHVYTVISSVDLLLCLSLFPVVDSALAEGRVSKVFTSNTTFCGAWTVGYAVLLDMSVFMVAAISVSRLILLIRPAIRLNPKVGWLIPLLYCILTFTIKITYIVLNVSSFSFEPHLMSCVYLALDGTVNEEGVPMVNLPNTLILAVTETIQTGFTVVPISLSSFLSLWFLRRSMNKTKQVGGRRKKQEEASKTVIIFTVMYVVFNIPIFLYNVFFWAWRLGLSSDSSYMSISEFLQTYLETYSSRFLVSYSSVLVSRVFPAINSTANPVLFVWRMESFRNFLCGKLKKQFMPEESSQG